MLRDFIVRAPKHCFGVEALWQYSHFVTDSRCLRVYVVALIPFHIYSYFLLWAMAPKKKKHKTATTVPVKKTPTQADRNRRNKANKLVSELKKASEWEKPTPTRAQSSSPTYKHVGEMYDTLGKDKHEKLRQVMAALSVLMVCSFCSSTNALPLAAYMCCCLMKVGRVQDVFHNEIHAKKQEFGTYLSGLVSKDADATCLFPDMTVLGNATSVVVRRPSSSSVVRRRRRPSSSSSSVVRRRRPSSVVVRLNITCKTSLKHVWLFYCLTYMFEKISFWGVCGLDPVLELLRRPSLLVFIFSWLFLSKNAIFAIRTTDLEHRKCLFQSINGIQNIENGYLKSIHGNN